MFRIAAAGAVAGAVALSCLASTAATARTPTTTHNLLVNAGAETGPGSVGSETNPPPDWTVTTGTSFSALIYGQTATDGPLPTDPGPKNRGANLFYGGFGDALSVATQLRSIPTSFRSAVDAGTATFTLQGYLGGWQTQDDNAALSVQWQNATGHPLGSSSIGPVTAADRHDVTALLLRHVSAAVPAHARKALVTLTLTRVGGSYDDGYADNLSLRLTEP